MEIIQQNIIRATKMYILAIESSCDETALAVYKQNSGLIAHKVFSQIDIHIEYGGVVPELASRDHIRHLLPILENLLEENHLKLADITGVCYTRGPGLIGALMAGAMFAKALSYALKVPALGIHHMEGHLLAPMLSSNKPSFPHLALIVSGGHTMFVKVGAIGKYEIIGDCLDDAAGEAFDKTAKLLGLGYPGGPAISKLAEQGQPNAFVFPRPLTNQPGLYFSFSGLKTFVANTIAAQGKLSAQIKADIALAFEQAVVDTFLIKCKRAIKTTGIKTLVLSGGVSANKRLRISLDDFGEKNSVKIYYPELEFCTDNAAMIAYAGAYRLANAEHDPDDSLVPLPRWPLDSQT